MDSSTYRIIRTLGFPFRYRVNGLEHFDRSQSGLFLANHLASLGPLMIILSMPIRLYPWVIANMLDYQRAPEYLHMDFVQPTLKINGRLGLAVARPIANIAVHLLNSIGSIPVDSESGWTMEAFRLSLKQLSQGHYLLIFPENAKLEMDSSSQMYPFNCGWVGLCRMYQVETGYHLPVYPMVIHPESRSINIGQSMPYQGISDRKNDIRGYSKMIELKMKEMYRDLGH